MSDLSDKYYSREELIQIALVNDIPEAFHNEFIVYVEKDIQEMTDEKIESESNIKRSATILAIDFFRKYLEELKKGHSEEWARMYANNGEDHENAFEQTYSSIKETNPEKAIEELKIHCKAVGGDDLYTEHFIYIMNNGMALKETGPDEQASVYSKIYKEQIEIGRSKIFSHYYADLMAWNQDSELSCFAEASEYETALSFGKSEFFAFKYAKEMSDYIANHYFTYEEALESPYYKLKKREIEESLTRI